MKRDSAFNPSSFIFSLTPRKRTKRGVLPQAPLQRGMQTESRGNRRLSVGFGKLGHGLSFLSCRT